MGIHPGRRGGHSVRGDVRFGLPKGRARYLKEADGRSGKYGSCASAVTGSMPIRRAASVPVAFYSVDSRFLLVPVQLVASRRQPPVS